jgi:hypothetical protein
MPELNDFWTHTIGFAAGIFILVGHDASPHSVWERGNHDALVTQENISSGLQASS